MSLQVVNSKKKKKKKKSGEMISGFEENILMGERIPVAWQLPVNGNRRRLFPRDATVEVLFGDVVCIDEFYLLSIFLLMRTREEE